METRKTRRGAAGSGGADAVLIVEVYDESTIPCYPSEIRRPPKISSLQGTSNHRSKCVHSHSTTPVTNVRAEQVFNFLYQRSWYITQLSLCSAGCGYEAPSPQNTFRIGHIFQITHPTPINSRLHHQRGPQGDLFHMLNVGPLQLCHLLLVRLVDAGGHVFQLY